MRTIIAAAIYTLILAAFCPALAAQSAPPTFLFLLEGKGTPTGTLHVFRLNPSTGAITEVPGSPFNAGLGPDKLVIDPTGRFVYVTNDQSQDITALSVDAASGALTELPGSPFALGAVPLTAAVDPTGRLLYVFAEQVVNGMSEEFLYEYTLDGVTGVPTASPSSPTPWEFDSGISIVSIAFSPAGNYAYLGQVQAGNQGAPTLICSVDFGSGTLTVAGSVQPAASGEASQIAVSPNGNLLYSIDTSFDRADAFTVGSLGASAVEAKGSPYATQNFPSALVVHPSGNFLYIANENEPFQTTEVPSQYDGSISAFAIDPGTGGLTELQGSPYAAGINPGSVVVDPTGSFVFAPSTNYTFGYTGFAQILGFSVNSSSGALTPFSGPAWTDSAESIGGGLAISHGPSTATNPVPMISSLSPSSAIASDTAFTLQINGANFLPGSTVYFGGQARSTMFVSTTQLNASVLATDVDNDGTAVVFVFNPLPGGGASTSVDFPVSALSPVISSISPTSIPAGTNSSSLFVFGSNFVTGSVVNINGTALATSYSGPTLLIAQISAAEIAVQGTASITVTTPTNGVPGGGTSNAVTLTIGPLSAPLVVSNISPTSATAGGAQFFLTVNGGGFVPGPQGSQVSFNLNNVATTFVSSTQLTASIPASAIAIASNPYVIVTNPNGSATAPITFTVIPGVGSVSPPSLPAGSNALTLNIIGTGFAPGSVVLVNGSSRVTVFESSTLLEATLLPSDLSQGGALNITVTNPPPGGTAGMISFTVSDYKVTPPGSVPPVTAGNTANIALTVAPMDGAFSNPVTFGISPLTPLPADATASFAPSATITPGAAPQTVTLSITTTAHSAASASYFRRGGRPGWLLLSLAGIAFALAGIVLRYSGRRAWRLAPQLFLALLLTGTVGLAACGGGAYSAPQTDPATGTPAGNYTITVTATSGGVVHTTTVKLSVM